MSDVTLRLLGGQLRLGFISWEWLGMKKEVIVKEKLINSSMM